MTEVSYGEITSPRRAIVPLKVFPMAEPSVSQQAATPVNVAAQGLGLRGGPPDWANDLRPIGPSDWSYERAAHLLERAGFGGTPEEIARLAAMTPERAVASLLDYGSIGNDH